MCQIFAGKANKIRATLLNTAGLMESLFERNNDGLGAMYATSKKVLRMPKVVPNTLAEAVAFIKQLPDDERNLVIHWRMKTSGKIDHDNAHPFVVVKDRIGMTHNGILTISTKSDPTMCDTRHYIREYLAPMLAVAPQLLAVSAWRGLVGDDIGSNRFVFMDNEGTMSFVNRSTGYELDGMWIANQYSFDAYLLFPNVKPRASATSLYDDDEWNNYAWPPKGYYKGAYPGNVRALAAPAATAVATVGLTGAALIAAQDEVWESVGRFDHAALAQQLETMPFTVFSTLFSECEFVPTHPADGTSYSTTDEWVVKALADGGTMVLVDYARNSAVHAAQVAEAACYYGNWVGKAIDKKVEPPRDLVAEAEGEVAVELAALRQELDDLEADLERIESEFDDVDARRAQLLQDIESLEAVLVPPAPRPKSLMEVAKEAIREVAAALH